MNEKTILPILILILLSIVLHAPSAQIELSFDIEIKEPEDIIFNNLKDIATDSNNNIYILDSKEKTLYKFSEEGKFQKRIGRQGQGPGEFAVLDFYTIEGEFIESIKIDEKIYFLASDKKGRLLAVKKNEEDFPTVVRYRVEINGIN